MKFKAACCYLRGTFPKGCSVVELELAMVSQAGVRTGNKEISGDLRRENSNDSLLPGLEQFSHIAQEETWKGSGATGF